MVVQLVTAIDDYIRWLHDLGYGASLTIDYETWTIQEGRPFGGSDVIGMLYAAHFARKFSLLAHVKRQLRIRPSPPISGLVERSHRFTSSEDTKRFPLKCTVPLLTEGFVKNPQAHDPLDREDVTGRLIATLLAGGGLRSSEPLHIWVNDISIVNGEPVVFLRHPQFSLVELPDGRSLTREEYLRNHCGMLPRNKTDDKFHSGWKGIKLNREGWAPMYWLPLPGLKEFFLAAYLEYISFIRPRLMRDRFSRGLADHPFFLVSSGSAQQDGDDTSIGDPYTRTAARNSWTRAIKRLQRLYPGVDLTLGKAHGTTRHGLRHQYGTILKQLGLPSPMIQECMHHISPRSQLVYQEPLSSEIHLALADAAENILRGGHSLSEFRFKTIDEAIQDPLR